MDCRFLKEICASFKKLSDLAKMSDSARWQDLILPVAIVTSVLVILVPMPSALMDLLLAANITVAVIVLLTTIYVRTPLEFSIFPSLLLATTLGRLVLNVASTRLILTRAAQDGLEAAGGVIHSFGDFVTGDRVVVGIIIFVIIVAIQFLVITKGATRISEVAARFALDGMPGRQMAIDADLNAGVIDEHEAQRRRDDITNQADFYGAMDGASKFVRGDAVAGIVITLINVVGGLVIGVFEFGMPIADAAQLFTKLTIGDGLVSQVPAFLISLAAGLLVTRSARSVNMPGEFLKQVFARPEAMVVAGVFLGALVFTNLPKFPLLSLGTGCISIAVMLQRQQKQSEEERAAAEASEQEAEPKPEERIEDYLVIDPMELEIGVGLIKLADPSRGGDLLPHITGVRQSVAGDIGIVLPKIRIRDNMQLPENAYRIKIANNPIADGLVLPDMILAMDSGMTTGPLPGEETKDPAFEQKAYWIEPGLRDRAEMFGYTPVEPSAVMSTHLHEVVRRYADELLTRDATKHLLDELKETSPAVVDELIPNVMKLAEVQQVLQLLLREQIPIRQLATILETLGDYAPRTKDPVWLAEYVRNRLARTICSRLADETGAVHVVTLDPALEDRVNAGIEHNERGMFVRMSPQAVDKTCEVIADAVQVLIRENHSPIVLVSPQTRPGLRRITSANLPNLQILSYNELTRDTRIESHGIVQDATAETPPG